MARVEIPIQNVPSQGKLDTVVWTAGDAANDHYFKNDGHVLLFCRNTDVSTKTVTVVSVPDEHGRSGDLTVTVPAVAGSDDGVSVAGTLTQSLWNQSTGFVHVDITGATGLFFAAVRIYPR